MGYKIEVNHSILAEAANTVNEYINILTQYMKKSDDVVDRLKSKDWTSQDAIAFTQKWSEMKSSTSVNEHMKASFRNYANELKYAETQYKNVQSNAINRAMSL